MDLVDYEQVRFEKIKERYKDFAAKLDIQDFKFIPISALKGDNVVNRSENRIGTMVPPYFTHLKIFPLPMISIILIFGFQFKLY